MKKKSLILALSILLINQVKAQTLNYYYGNIHAHSSYSDGNKDSATSLITKPIQDFNYAKNSQHIDFYGISEHNHLYAGMTSPSRYHQGIKDAKAATINGTFVALYGMEYGVISNGGHVLVYGYDSLLIGWDNGYYDVFNAQYNYATLWKKINAKPSSFAYFAHPSSADYDSIYFKPYNASFDSAIVGTPFRSGPAFSTNTTYSNPATGTYLSQYNIALKKGYHVGIGLDHDTHNSVFGRQTAGRLVIMAPSLTENDLFSAMKSMRFYGSDDWNVKVDFTVNSQVMGSILTHSGTAAISVNITDPDLESTSNITVYYGIPGSGTAAAILTSTTSSNTLNFTHAIANNLSYYYYLKITQLDGDVIYTSPIWYTRNDLINQYPPVSDFTATSSNTACANTFTLTDNSTNTPTSWNWYIPGATPSTSTLQNPVVTYTAAGISNITLISTNISGSSAQITKTVSVATCVGIQELTAQQISVYPNPANSLIYINVNNAVDFLDIKLIDVLGKEIMTSTSKTSITELNVSNVKVGTYFLKITDTNHQTFTKLIVVNH